MDAEEEVYNLIRYILCRCAVVPTLCARDNDFVVHYGGYVCCTKI